MEKRERRNSFFRRAALAACLFACVSSCKKDGAESEAPAAGAFTALTESHAGDGKTGLDPSGKVLWKRSDRIMVYSSNGSYEKGVQFVAETAGESSEFEAGETVPAQFLDGPSYAAVYPYDKCGGFKIEGSDTTFTVTIPDAQEYVAGGFASGANPMVSFAKGSNVLPFKNVCGMLRLQLCGVTPVKSIRIEDETRGGSLCGDFTFRLDKGVPVFKSVSGGSSVITLNVNDAYDAGNPATYLNLDTPREFLVLLPAGSCASGFKVTVEDPWGGTWSKQALGSANEIERSKIKEMRPVNAITSIAMYDDAKGNAVRWATVNLGAHAPWEYGDYYAWGATEVLYTPAVYNVEGWWPGDDTELDIKSHLGGKSYGWNSWCPFYTGNGSTYTFSKYTGSDDKLELDPDDDVASVVYGGAWRMPEAGKTADNWDGYTGDFKDLCVACGISGTTVSNNLVPYGGDGVGKDVKGMWFESNAGGYSGHKIFFPAAGRCDGTSRREATSYGYYWSRSHYSSTPYDAYALDFYSGNVVPTKGNFRLYGMSVRPVL